MGPWNNENENNIHLHTNGSFNGAIFNFYLLIELVPRWQPGPALVTHLSLAECVLKTSKLHSGPSESSLEQFGQAVTHLQAELIGTHSRQ